jgi:DNA repair exonuclease SbcCD nuclease subunit
MAAAMAEIVVVGDVHEGISFSYHLDPETGISERALDLHRNFVRASEHAISHGAALFVIVGDLFDRTHVSPTAREMVRRDVIEPLWEAGVEVWILAGNHDQPHNPGRGTSLEDFRGYPHVSIFRQPAFRNLTLDGKGVDLLLLPYLHPEQIALLVQKRWGKEVPKEQVTTLGQTLLQQWLQNRVSESRGGLRILFGHYHIEGAKIRETSYLEVLPGEFSLRKEMIPEEIDLAVFGHIHLHQALGKRGKTEIVYTGAPERIDWGERDDRKGFITIDTTSGTWRFVELPCREMVKVQVEVQGREDPTERILEAIPPVEGKMVRLEVLLEEGQRVKVVDSRIAERLRGAFHYDVLWKERTGETRTEIDFTMNPYELLRTYIQGNYDGHPGDIELLLETGERILREVLE